MVTPQTGPQRKRVERLYIEAAADIAAEFYAAVLVDRVTQTICLMASSSGGMDIEEVAKTKPETLLKLAVDPGIGLTDEAALALAKVLGFAGATVEKAADFFRRLYRVFVDNDASLVEVNPFALLADGSLQALDAKMTFDDNALWRHPEFEALRDPSEEDPLEMRAKASQLSYIALDGNIACMVNGAGLAMATMDAIKLYGGEPANFLDVGGSATVEKVTSAFEIMLSNPKVSTVLVNIFGGIMRCDTIAEGIVEACRRAKPWKVFMSRMILFCVTCSASVALFWILKATLVRGNLQRTFHSCRISSSSCRKYLLKFASTEIPVSICLVVSVPCFPVSRKLHRKFRRRMNTHLFHSSVFTIPYILSWTVLFAE